MRRLAGVLAIVVVGAQLALAGGNASTATRPEPICLPPILICPSPAPTSNPSPSPAPTATRPPVDKIKVYRGLGAWVDAYDFSRELGGKLNAAGSVDNMARQGVKTLYLQAAKDDPKVKGALLSPDLLGQWLERAHARNIKVVAWYLPKFTNPAKDWGHLDAMLKFRSHGHAFDAIGVDIEARDVKDPKVRSQRLIDLSRKLRKATALPTSAIVVPPVVLDKINPNFWPNFPWKDIKSSYDVWAPMGYYTYRTKESGYRDAYRYTVDNIDLLRRDVGDPNAPVHIVGGLAGLSSTADHDGLMRGARDRKAIGASTYDYATTKGDAWPALRKAPGN